MRILQIINDLRVAGAESLCAQLTTGLRAEGNDIRVLALSEVDSPLSRSLGQSGALVSSAGAAAGSGSLRSLKNVARIRAIMPEFDVVHAHLFPTQMWATIAHATLPKHRRPRLVTTEHNTFNRRRKKWYRRVDLAMYARYDRIVAISDATSTALTQWVPEISQRVVVIPNGIDIDRFANAKPAPRATFLPDGAPTDAPLLLCAGRLTAQKDQATALQALAEIPGAHFCLAGEGELTTDLERLAEGLGIRDRVHFLGRRDDLPEILKSVDVYIQPSRWEGFGLAVVEAMAAGCPVVCSDVPGMREVVGDAGWTFPAGDARTLTDRINQVLDNSAQASEITQRARFRAQEFSLERFIEAHGALYKNLTREA